MACIDYTLLLGDATSATWCSDSSHIGAFTASLAFNGVKDGAAGQNDAWMDNNQGVGQWWQVVFPSSKKIMCARFQTRELNGSFDSWYSSWTWRGMATGGTWGVDDVVLFTGAVPNYSTIGGGGFSDWVEFTSPDFYEEYRVVTAGVYNLNGPFDRVQIQEFEFYEDATPPLELEFNDWGSTAGIITHWFTGWGFGKHAGLSFPFGGPTPQDQSTLAMALALKAFNLQAVFGINSEFKLSAFSIESIIQKVIDIKATQALRSFRLEAEVVNERQVVANLQIGKLSIETVMSKDQLIQGALKLGALNLSSVVTHLSTAEGNFTLSPFALKTKGLKPLDYVVLRFEK